ncbi:MAG: hypothetical protein OEY14_07075 [Myxococcales bacterium]|nr:hypothetical protein [Myxococcales bacterium]
MMLARRSARLAPLRLAPLGFGLALFALLGSGCGAGAAPADAAFERDAFLGDGASLVDGGADARLEGGADAAPDGGAGDASLACAEGCDPRGGVCPGVGPCLLQGAQAACGLLAGAGLEGEICDADDGCAPSLACFATFEGPRCQRICCPGAAGECDALECIGGGQLGSGAMTDWGHCSPQRVCDVLDPASCAPAEGCYILSGMGDTQCRRAGPAQVGEGCVAQWDCAAGLFCGGRMVCVRICALVGPPCPAGEGECVATPQSPDGSGLCRPIL